MVTNQALCTLRACPVEAQQTNAGHHYRESATSVQGSSYLWPEREELTSRAFICREYDWVKGGETLGVDFGVAALGMEQNR